jgi:hypothetical protein
MNAQAVSADARAGRRRRAPEALSCSPVREPEGLAVDDEGAA